MMKRNGFSLRMADKDQDAGDRHNNDRRTQVIRQEENAAGCDRAEHEHPDDPFHRIGLAPEPAQFIGNKQDHRDLRDLRRLKRQVARQADPPPRPVQRHAQRRLYKSHHDHGKHIDLHRKGAVHMIIDPGYKDHDNKTGHADQRLTGKVIQVIAQLHLAPHMHWCCRA